MGKERTCKYCGKKFIDKKYRLTFCSRTCATSFFWKDKKQSPIKICEQCGEEFTDERHRHRFCSYTCSSKSRVKETEKDCKFCGEKFTSKTWRNQIFCCKDCSVNYLLQSKPEKMTGEEKRKRKSEGRKKCKEKLTDGYIKHLLVDRTGMSAKNVVPELIEAKRLQMKIKRFIKNSRK